MTHRAPLLTCFAAVFMLTACGEQNASSSCFDLAEVRRYGIMDDGESDGTAPAVLGDVRGVVAAPNGDVYVLDRAAHCIIAFDSAGAARVVAGRAGEGPGEFDLRMCCHPMRPPVASSSQLRSRLRR